MEVEEDPTAGTYEKKRRDDETARLRAVQYALAVSGVGFPGSPPGIRALQALALLCQIGNLIYIGFWMRWDKSDDAVRSESYDGVWALEQIIPLVFLHYIACSKERESFLSAVRVVSLKPWMIFAPLIPVIGFAIVDLSFPQHKKYYTVPSDIFSYLPCAVGSIVIFCYADSFAKKLPKERNPQQLKEAVIVYNRETNRAMARLNMWFVLPNVLIWLIFTMINLWYTLGMILKPTDDDDEGDYNNPWYNGLNTALSTMMVYFLLLPLATYTGESQKWVYGVHTELCNGDVANIAFIMWLKDSELGWELANVKLTPERLSTLGYFLTMCLISTASFFMQNVI